MTTFNEFMIAQLEVVKAQQDLLHEWILGQLDKLRS
jgi:hypothetical protein